MQSTERVLVTSTMPYFGRLSRFLPHAEAEAAHDTPPILLKCFQFSVQSVPNKMGLSCVLFVPLLFRMYGLQQRYLQADSGNALGSNDDRPPKPSWINVQNGGNLGSVLVVLIPYLDLELLRIYASGDPRVAVASSQLTQEALKELFGSMFDMSEGRNCRSVLKQLAGNKISMRPPPMTHPPYCPVVQVCKKDPPL